MHYGRRILALVVQILCPQCLVFMHWCPARLCFPLSVCFMYIYILPVLSILSCPGCLTYNGFLPDVTNCLVLLLPDFPLLVSFLSYLNFSCLSYLQYIVSFVSSPNLSCLTCTIVDILPVFSYCI